MILRDDVEDEAADVARLQPHIKCIGWLARLYTRPATTRGSQSEPVSWDAGCLCPACIEDALTLHIGSSIRKTVKNIPRKVASTQK